MQRQSMKQMQKQPTQKMQKQPKQQMQKQSMQQQQSKQPKQQPQKPQLSQTGQAMWLPVLGKLVPPTGVIPGLVTVPTTKTQPKAKKAVSKVLPAPEMMHDYAAASPRIFPHTCSLCNKECTDMKDWLSHQNSSLHLKSCTLLRKQFPKWGGEIALEPRAAGKDAKPSTSTSAQKTRHASSSSSKSPSPHRQRGPEGRREKRRSRSNSPQSFRYNRRSRSRSCSPRYDRPTSSSYRSRSGSSERWSSPRRKDERQSPSRKGRNRYISPPMRRVDNRRSPPRRSNETRSPQRRGMDRWSPPRRSFERLSPPRRGDNRWSPPRRSFESWSSPKKSDESLSPPRRSHERLSSREGSSPQRKRSNSAESLAKKLLETTAVQSLSSQSDLETVVKTLAPALLAELAKMSSSSTASSFKRGKPSLPRAKLRLQKSEASCSTKMKNAKVSPPTMVKLQGISNDLSHNDVVAAMERFGKIKSVLLFRKKLEANVCFENEEDAKKVKSLKSLDVKGMTITVVRERKAVAQKQMKHPLIKSAFHPQTTNYSMGSATRKVLLPTPSIPPLMVPLGAKKSTAGKRINQKIAAKDSANFSVKGVRTVNKAKGLVSKAKYVSTKQIAKTIKATKLPPEYQQEVVDSKQKPVPEKSDTSVEQNVMGQKETAEHEGKFLAFKTETDSTTQNPKLSAGCTVKIEKDTTMLSKTTAATNQTDTEAAKVDKSESRNITGPGKGPLLDAAALAFKSETVSSMQKPNTPTEKQAAKNAGTKESVAEDATVPPIMEASENQPDTGDSKQKPVSEKPETSVKKPATQVDKLAESGAVATENVEETAAKGPSVPSRSTALNNQPDVEMSKHEESETKVQESLVVSEDTAEVVDKANVTAFEPKDRAKLDKADDAEPMELGVTGVKVAEPMEVESCTEGKGKEMTSAEAVPEDSADQTNQPPTSTETQPAETSVKALTKVQQSILSEPESMTQGPETQIEVSQVQRPAAGSTNEAAVEPLMPGGGAAIKTTQKEVAQIDLTSAEVSIEVPSSVNRKPTAAAGSKQQPAASKRSSSADHCPSVGDIIESNLFPNSIDCFSQTYPNAQSVNRPLLITGLPLFFDGCYTEDDVANLLGTFGYRHTDDKLYIIPQKCMAFAMLPSMVNVIELIKKSLRSGVSLKGNKLHIQVLIIRSTLTPLQFYRYLKKNMAFHEYDEGERTILIKNISQSETSELREALKDFGSVKYFMPLLNKLFVEFESVQDVYRFGGWYSHQNRAPGHEVIWLKRPNTSNQKLPETNQSFGELMEMHLTKDKINSLKCRSVSTQKLLITSLPVYGDGCYTEDDIVKLLTPFGYQHKDQNIYVVPQARVAFALMQTSAGVRDLIEFSRTDPISLKGSTLSFNAMTRNISMKPVWFYECLMKELGYHEKDTREKVVFIRNVSQSEKMDIRETLKKIGSVWNFLPLLNKVFVEFESAVDADRLGVWYSLLKHIPNHRVQRLKIPYDSHCLSPRLPENALPDSKDAIDGATVPPIKVGVPQGSASPFWVTMRNSPFVFPTISPWFIIPEHKTVKGIVDIEKASRRGSMCPTIMLTGLPDCRDYRHEDVAKLVWPYFPKQTIHSLYYNLIVLPLQRRAFVFFSDWTTCCDFVQDHITNQISFKGQKIIVHFVLQHMYPESSEEMMYKSMMKWSNAGVPDSTSLEERLLCVEISEASVDIITLVIEMVASITPFVNFLPLANRICIEMADSSAVTQVVEKYNLSPNSFTEDPAWSKVQHFETLKSLKQRLQDSAEVTINLDLDTSSVEAKTPPNDKNVLKDVTVTVGHERHVQKSRSQSEEKEGQEDFTQDNMSSDAYLFDEQQFNEEDFITIEEVGDDTDDASPEPHHTSSSRHSYRERRRRRSSSVSSDRERTSTRSSKEYKSSASSLSSRSIKGSRSSYSSSVSRNSSKPTKSRTKPSSSASASKASSSSSSKRSPKSSSSSASQKTQQSSTRPPAKSSKNTSSNRTGSSSPAHQREKVKSQASKETHSEQLGEEAQDAESAVAQSDHRVSAESPAAKTVESETKIEAAREMHPPQQGRGLESSQAQSLDGDFNVKTLKDQKKEDGGQEGSSETQLTEPEGGHVLDIVQDEGKPRPEEYSETGIGSLQVLDSVPKDQAATGEEDLVQMDSCTVQQLFKEDEDPVVDTSEDTTEIKDEVGEVQETNNEEKVLDTGGKQAQTGRGDEKKTKQKEEEVEGKMLSVEFCKDAENLKSRNPNEDHPLQEGDVKDHDSDGTEHEAFEILDSIDDQTETEDVSQKPETSSAQCNRPIEEEDPDTFQVIDSVEDQPMDKEKESDSENKHKMTKKGEATASKCDRPSRRSGPKSKVSVSEEKEKSPKKQDRTVKKYETRTKVDTIADKEVTEKIMYEIVDAVEEEPVEDSAVAERPGRRRSTRGKKDGKINLTEASEKPEEVTFKIIDSVENETANDEPIVTRRSTRGRRGNTMKDALSEKTVQEDTPTRRRQTPARESRSREKTPKKEEKAPPKESTPTKKSASVVKASEEDATYEILDSVGDEVVEDKRPTTRGKGKRGRPKKQIKTTKKGSTTSKEVENMADDGEVTYQILDSVEDETVDQPRSDQSKRDENISKDIDKQGQKSTSLTGSTQSEKEDEEPLFQIVDSVEDDPVQEELFDKETKEKSKTKDEAPQKDAEKEDTPTSCTTVSEASEKDEGLHQIVEDLGEVNNSPSLVEGSDTGKKERTTKTDIKKEDTSPIKSMSDSVILKKKDKRKLPEKNVSASTLVNLDEVSDEEEDYPDDTAEEEELRKRQAAAKERRLANEQETRRTRERERRSRSSSRDEKAEVNAQGLVTLDEVGADEAEDEKVPERQEWEEDVTEVQALVTLDEFVEEEPEGKAEQSKLETPPLSQEDESVDDLNQETLVTLDEAGYDEEEKPNEEQAKEILRSGKRKHDDDTDASMNFVIVDEVKDEEKREAVTPKTRGRAKKRARQTPVRKSTRGKDVSSQEEREEEKEPNEELPPTSLKASSSLDKDSSKGSSVDQLLVQETTEVGAVRQPDTDAPSAGPEPQPKDKTLEGCVEEEKEGRSRTDIKVVSKQRRELDGPAVKRSRSQSPCVASDFTLPAFKPSNPLGKEFVVPGFFCNLCSVFYLNESTAKELHCSSQKHYDNLQKHYQKLRQKSSSSTQSPRGSFSE
uniref:uncharacterized protein n=1 Tax=Semicossyphus pulcher TaxID=241346 RepID=UPI0037E8B342